METRICAVEGCGKELGKKNKTGYCKDHIDVHVDRRSPKNKHICVQCGQNFLSINKHAKTCSTKCRNLFNYKHEKKPTEKRICPICDQEFEANGSNWGQKYCSHKCSKRATAKKELMDIQHVLKKRIRCRVNEFINDKNIKVSGCIRFLGCSIDELKQRFESMFYPNPETGETMTWDNYGFYGWHIDHIKPLDSFDIADPEQFKEACYYTNLQPLWAKDNLKKGSKYEQ